jgi:hypothetical protein
MSIALLISFCKRKFPVDIGDLPIVKYRTIERKKERREEGKKEREKSK